MYLSIKLTRMTFQEPDFEQLTQLWILKRASFRGSFGISKKEKVKTGSLRDCVAECIMKYPGSTNDDMLSSKIYASFQNIDTLVKTCSLLHIAGVLGPWWSEIFLRSLAPS